MFKGEGRKIWGLTSFRSFHLNVVPLLAPSNVARYVMSAALAPATNSDTNIVRAALKNMLLMIKCAIYCAACDVVLSLPS